MLLVCFIVIHLFWWKMAHLMLYWCIIHFGNVIEEIPIENTRSTVTKRNGKASCILSLFDISTWDQTHNFQDEENYWGGVHLMKSDFEWHDMQLKNDLDGKSKGV